MVRVETLSKKVAHPYGSMHELKSVISLRCTDIIALRRLGDVSFLLTKGTSKYVRRRAKLVMARLGVPIVDAASIVDGQTWASRLTDGRHYQRIVPVEVFDMLGALISPPPAPLVPATDVTVRQDESDCGLRLAMSGADRGGS